MPEYPTSLATMWQTLELTDSEGSLDLIAEPDLWVQMVDLGFPSTRRANLARSGASGELDFTEHHGARGVTIAVGLRGSDAGGFDGYGALADKVLGFLRPDRRPWLRYRRDGDPQDRYMLLAPDQADGLDWSQVDVEFPVVTLQFRCPDGASVSAEEEVVVSPVVLAAGRTYSPTRSYPRTYPAGGVGEGPVILVNAGNNHSPFVARFYGPCSGPRLENLTNGGVLAFDTSWFLGADEYVEVDSLARTVRLGGPDGPSRYRDLLWPTSRWFHLSPGPNELRYVPQSYSDPSSVVVAFRSRWL